MSVHIDFETPADVQEKVYELVKKIGKEGSGRFKKGMNEVIKVCERGAAKLVVMAENVNPGEMMMPIPLICKERGIPYIYVADQGYLGEAAGLPEGRPTSAIAVTELEGSAEDFDSIVASANTLASN
ncbi:MAG TPA: 50S ribosomal protein L7ae [Candidatus Thalassarchaeaceae archaeon]|jgi:large subunit ribosomal protein L7Ae|nr:50S ribosomal protein L7ae [Euryarchaeota archaeon]MDP6378143.1 ribosomal L7Ae/L30e/S12e/Gadd45 family protein [Candidatus Thalassarchaeaceae archaeon]DAC51037.1 MAG TPA: 50S ribosomal protein L7ae [Candidatus Poseidoniales archaeon]MDP6741641.1 ribosomal L7Ae/L30e/S12e/Gadd45 family protein [Candidatus Thalassarchaeaceae archaeon]MDP7043256.1 ribosomal L7Ae/L30e/S12e/Gadd45 family protein [Candidatus Thalassarchaeaceae archaeon]|tara:strand:+ start:1047 stop:1427 length:381 start_codon:yes stop_codon:yes gene_type:complete